MKPLFSDEDFKDIKPERFICEEAEFFKKYLSERGIKTTFVAKKINFSPQRLTDLFTGRYHKMSPKMINSLVAYLKIPITELPEIIKKHVQ